jgi:hypothetical protein
MRIKAMAISCSMSLLVVATAGVVDAQLAWMDPAVFYFYPPGQPADLIIYVAGIPDLWGVDFWVTYDPTQIHLIDPITQGVCPAPDLQLVNSVDNVNGVGRYAVSAFGSGPCDCENTPNQIAAVYTFTLVGTYLWSAIDFSLVDPPGISAMANNSVEVCNETTPECWQGAVAVPVELMSITVD